jgi:hypothetical protein
MKIQVAQEFGKTKVIPVLVEVLKVVSQEKVLRVAVASLRVGKIFFIAGDKI